LGLPKFTEEKNIFELFSGVHQLACPSETDVYAAETANWRVQKLTFRTTPQTSTKDLSDKKAR
jgi:hypothetical protein